MGNEIFNELIASLIVGFMTVCFSVFPKYRGFMFIILTIFIGAWAIIAEMKYKAFIWGGAIVVMPLIFSMMYFIFSGMNRAYSLSLLCGLIVSTVIIWLMAVGVICYEIGLVTADNNSGRIVADDEAVMKIQGEFDAYKENANKIIADLGQKISDLQKGLDTEKAGREDAENRLYLQVSIHSEDIKKFQAVISDYDRVMHTLFFNSNDDAEYVRYYYNQALDLFREKAKQGSIEASFLTGYILDPLHTRIKVSGIKQNADSAIKSYEKAASQGHNDAQYLLANLYYSVKKDNAQAVKWYKLAAEGGHKQAQEMLKYIGGNK